MIAASLLLATASITHFERNTSSNALPQALETRAASAQEWQTIEREVPVAFSGPISGGTLEVRAKTKVTKEERDTNAFRIKPQLAFEIARNGKSERYVVPIDDWGYFNCHRALKPSMPVTPFGRSNSAISGVIVSTFESDCGAHMASGVENIYVIDVQHARPRVMQLAADQVETWGYTNGGLYRRDGNLTCTWKASDFICGQKEKIETPFGDFIQGRRFTLFGRKALRAEGAHSLPDAARLQSDRPILVDGIGPLIPVTRMGVARLYASLETVDVLTATFYLFRDGKLVSVKPGEVSDEFRDPLERVEQEPEAIVMTRTNNVATFRAKELARTPHSDLLQIVLESGDARSLFWVAIDVEELQLAALRVASTARESEDRRRVVPGSIIDYKAIDDQHFAVDAYGPWVDDVFDGASCEGESDDDCDVFKGVIEWSPTGFSMSFVEQPQDLGAPEVTIAADGTLGRAPREHAEQ